MPKFDTPNCHNGRNLSHVVTSPPVEDSPAERLDGLRAKCSIFTD